jgi:hypothetical protein
MQNDKLDELILYRNELIEKLETREITKTDFIKANYEYISNYKISPYAKIENIQKGVLAYQYFNSTAKYLLSKAFDIELKNPKKAYEIRENGFENYNYKNNIIKKVLEIVNYKNVEAFFVKMNSKALEGELFEIVLKDYEKVIFHTRDKLILNRLKKNGCFIDGIRDSLIDEYINKKY